MLFRLIVFKVVFAALVVVSVFGLAIHEGVHHSLSPTASHSPTAARRILQRYTLPLVGGCAAVALLAAFGDLLLAGRRKGALPTYTDEEFLAKFGGSPDAQQPSQ